MAEKEEEESVERQRLDDSGGEKCAGLCCVEWGVSDGRKV